MRYKPINNISQGIIESEQAKQTNSLTFIEIFVSYI